MVLAVSPPHSLWQGSTWSATLHSSRQYLVFNAAELFDRDVPRGYREIATEWAMGIADECAWQYAEPKELFRDSHLVCKIYVLGVCKYDRPRLEYTFQNN